MLLKNSQFQMLLQITIFNKNALLKNNPTDNKKQTSTQSYWYEAVNKDSEEYYWNETTMTVTKRRPSLKVYSCLFRKVSQFIVIKSRTMIISSLADFLNLENVSLATGAGTLTKKSFLPPSQI